MFSTFLFSALLAAAGAAGLSPPPAGDLEPLTVRASAPGERYLRPDADLDFVLSRSLLPGVERIAVLIADVDWSGLFTLDGHALRYHGPARLPSGESTMVVYLVTAPNTWQQIASMPLRVSTAAGFEQAQYVPKADVNLNGQVFETHQPDSAAPARSRFQDLTFGFGLQSRHARNTTSIATQSNFVTVSDRSLAPRFSTEGTAAPLVDLSDYVWTVDRAAVKVSLGQGAFSPERHLMNGFSSRGVSLTVRRSRTDATLAILNGNSIVGFDNFFGVSTAGNRVGLLVLGAELIGSRPGGARLEASIVDGSRLPRAGFNQAQVNDVDRSTGEGLRFVGNDSSRRLRIDTGFARSEFRNGADPLLAQGFTLVQDRARTDHAEYVDLSYDVARGARLGRQAATLTTSYRFERVDPLFASVGAPQGVRSDLLQHTIEINGGVGPVIAQLSRVMSRDNLGEVASILRTDTGITSLNLLMPTGGLRPGAATAWLPVVTYSVNRSSQIGQALPADGGFASASQIPNQVNTVHTVRVDWSWPGWRIGYTVNHSLVDNRQQGRELADLANLVQGVTASRTVAANLDVSGDLNLEHATNEEFHQETRTWRVGSNIVWRVTPRMTINAIANHTLTSDQGPSSNRTNDFNLQWSESLTTRARGSAKPRAQLFGRWSWLSSSAFDALANGETARRNWSMDTGLTLSVF